MASRLLMNTDPRMKTDDTNSANPPSRRESQTTRSTSTAALNAMLRLAYRRHTRGRLALAAVAACLGQ